ncbi:MAG: YbhB/YbcL family Raf kinase inhibitor-like protein [Chthoniobacterales bacterium]
MRVALLLLLQPFFAATADTVNDTEMKISTRAFSERRPIPERFTADGENINPALAISGVPREAKSLALIVDDPDAPMGVWNHWLVWNIKPDTTAIKEDSVPHGAIVGCNDAGSAKYVGPSPPSGTHRYYFRLYALDTKLDLPADSTRAELDDAIHSHILARAELLGRYARE